MDTPASNMDTPASNMDTRPWGWKRLPQELRLFFFDVALREIAADGQRKEAWLTLNKDWLEFLESKTFQHLIVDSKDLPDHFSAMIPRHRSMVEHIWLRIELEPYDCPDCECEGKNNYVHNKDAVENAIVSIFSILHGWEKKSNITEGTVTLEISAHSPSDTQHVFKDYLVESVDSDPSNLVNDLQPASLHDPRHGWEHGQRTRTPSVYAFSRMHKFGLSSFLFGLPQVKSIKALLIRRQMRRTFSPESLRGILECLPLLESLQFECWKSMLCGQYNPAFSSFPLESLSPRMKRLVLFEDFSEDCNEAVSKLYPDQPFNTLGREQDDILHLEIPLVVCSLGIECLSISYIMGAARFFQLIQTQSHWVWPRLASLSLRSTLTEGTHIIEVTNLLRDAAAAAKRMPMLKIMEIWNGGKGHASAFSYHDVDALFMISWKGTWRLRLEDAVVEAWEQVNKMKHTSHAFVIKRHPLLNASEIRSHGDAIHALQLTTEVVHPVSLKQIRREAYYSFSNSSSSN